MISVGVQRSIDRTENLKRVGHKLNFISIEDTEHGASTAAYLYNLVFITLIIRLGQFVERPRSGAS